MVQQSGWQENFFFLDPSLCHRPYSNSNSSIKVDCEPVSTYRLTHAMSCQVEDQAAKEAIFLLRRLPESSWFLFVNCIFLTNLHNLSTSRVLSNSKLTGWLKNRYELSSSTGKVLCLSH